ncbi:d421b121-ec5e-43db-98e0-5841cd8ee22f [Sclerotinia trifoliorum]|uniref:D421b121-ec5e-43db-98e0-5841cd8ee22f n=1 Tax=Sclerotinia trifoliorum TaxID=28548 RepID=A0A8H2VTK4_9HELO|nr:d421b121-ec5e-43db-98e0-5841cd8ee22f [Sclerotinia trifoliorum]
MDDFLDTSGIDMNNSSNLSIYIQLITFRKGSAEEVSIDVPEDCQVKTARCLAERLNFRFRFLYDTRKVIITRDASLHSLELPDLDYFEAGMQESYYHDYIDTRDTNMNVDISTYQDFSMPLYEFSSGFEAAVQNIGLSDELFSGKPLNLDDATFNDLADEFPGEHIGDETFPDWEDLVNIVDQHDLDLDTDMLDNTQLDNSTLDNALQSCQTNQLEINTSAGTMIQNPITDIPAWRETHLAPAAVLDMPIPRPLSRAETIQNVRSNKSQSQGIDIAIKSSLDRNHSSLDNTPSSYQEGVFSSTPRFSSMPTTYGSSPRRMGPLDSATRAKANAVKALGACWRCRFLRKPCDAQTCCSQCKGKQGGPWHSIGCKRGEIKNKMLPISLCSRKTIGSLHSPAISDMNRPWLHANHCSREIFEQREKDLLPGIMRGSSPTEVHRFLQNLETGESPLCAVLKKTRMSLVEKSNETVSAVLKPLDYCIMTILWGLLECEKAQRAIHLWMALHSGTLEDFIILLNAAAVYQASIGSNQLIAYSLTCLRTCVEALHVKALGGFEGSHEACDFSTCKVDCIRNIELQMEQYLDELSRVVFMKENMRSRIWWLSAFYSLCIQGVIRQFLILLSSTGQNQVSESDESSSAQYLHIAIRLFTVSSGNHDPLIKDWSSELAFLSTDGGAPSIEDYQNAQLAIKQTDWRLKGIKKSGNYLKRLFEDNGGTLAEPDDASKFRNST